MAGSSRFSGERTDVTAYSAGPEQVLGVIMALNKISQSFADKATCANINNTPSLPIDKLSTNHNLLFKTAFAPVFMLPLCFS